MTCPQRFSEVEQALVEDFAQAFSKLKIDKSSYIVVVTHGHKGNGLYWKEPWLQRPGISA